MEVTVDSIEGQRLPQDTFISVRIGDVQKQSRMVSSRTYRFPDPGGDRRTYGRVEIFKRIGAKSVSFENFDGMAQDLQVDCNEPMCELINLRLGVKAKPAKVDPSEPTKDVVRKQRIDECQQYLAAHNLEELLSEAMREVIRTKPENPQQILADFILSKKLPAKKTPPPMEKTKLPPKPSQSDTTDVDELRGMASSLLLQASSDGRLESALKSAKATKATDTDDVDELRNMASSLLLEASSDGRLESALKSAKATKASDTDDVNELRNMASSLLLQASGDGRLESALKSAKATKASGTEEIDPRQDKSSALRMKASNLLLEAANDGRLDGALDSIKAKGKPTAPAPVKSFKFLPSVGTWAMQPSKMKLASAPSASTAPAAPAGPSPHFKLLPSVGTWLAPLPLIEHLPAAKRTGADEPWIHKPSVGTWLETTPFEVERPWMYKKMGGPNAQYIENLQGLLSEQDKEIERLKAMLASK